MDGEFMYLRNLPEGVYHFTIFILPPKPSIKLLRY